MHRKPLSMRGPTGRHPWRRSASVMLRALVLAELAVALERSKAELVETAEGWRRTVPLSISLQLPESPASLRLSRQRLMEAAAPPEQCAFLASLVRMERVVTTGRME